jgi:hypothetical protein
VKTKRERESTQKVRRMELSSGVWREGGHGKLAKPIEHGETNANQNARMDGLVERPGR